MANRWDGPLTGWRHSLPAGCLSRTARRTRRILLRAITEHEEFGAALSGTELGFARELLDVAARLGDSSLAFSEPDTQRTLDTTRNGCCAVRAAARRPRR